MQKLSAVNLKNALWDTLQGIKTKTSCPGGTQSPHRRAKFCAPSRFSFKSALNRNATS